MITSLACSISPLYLALSALLLCSNPSIWPHAPNYQQDASGALVLMPHTQKKKNKGPCGNWLWSELRSTCPTTRSHMVTHPFNNSPPIVTPLFSTLCSPTTCLFYSLLVWNTDCRGQNWLEFTRTSESRRCSPSYTRFWVEYLTYSVQVGRLLCTCGAPQWSLHL